MIHRARTSITAGLVCLSTLAHADPRELPQLFKKRARVELQQPGMQALELPVEVLRACRPGLSDLRLFAEGQELAYLVDSTGPDAWTLAEKRDAKAGRVRQDPKAPLCDPAPAVGAPATHCETIEIAGPPKDTGWELVFEIPGERVVERVEIASRNGDKLVPLVHAESIYRLPGGPGERLRLALPATATGAALTIVLQGEGAPPSPKLRYERGQRVRGTDSLETPLSVASTWHDRQGTHVLLDRPSGILPTALQLDTSTSTFDRAVKVIDIRGSERQLVGDGRVSRIVLPAAGVTVPIEEREISLGTSRGKKLELVIDDGDSPQLAGLAVRAIVRRPVLIFDRGSASPLELLFGGGRAEAPRYDLQSLLPTSLTVEDGQGARAEIAARLRQRQGLQHAALGPIESNPRFDPTPALATVAHPGSPVDLSQYEHARPLPITPSPDGLSRYLLAPSDLAAARTDLSDLRVVDGESRQWPYLLDREVDPLLVALPAPRARSKDGRTRYELALPAAPLAVIEVVLDIKEGFFDRELSIIGTDEAGREEIVEHQHIGRRLGELGAITVPVQLALSRVSTLAVEVIDHGDAPLTIIGAQIRVPTAALLLAAPAGSYRLLVGNPDEQAVSYELSSLGSFIAQLDPAEIKADPLGQNPGFSRSARLRSGGARERLLVWLALGLAVLVLGGLTLRMARSEGGGDPA